MGYTYTGRKQPKPKEQDPVTKKRVLPYLPSSELVEAVNIAIFLQRPLLLKGEPGCGKTRLASAVAYELGLPLYAWYVKSTSQAREGLYNYDAVGRLRDAQLAAVGQLTEDKLKRVENPLHYVRLGAIGKAFGSDKPAVVLIDEIDKADLDFPNDLLLELDEQRFYIEETGQQVRAKHPPIVLITSNDEKELPDAFLRRCLFHYVQFPSQERLMQILRAHFQTGDGGLMEQSVAQFIDLRSKMQADKRGMGKRVSTSELLDWFRVLDRDFRAGTLPKVETLPYAGVLLKRWEDYCRYAQP